MIKDHVFPETVAEAVDLLDRYAGRARVIAGGTDLIIQMKKKEAEPEVLIDIQRIEALGRIEEENGRIAIGAGATFSQLEESELIRDNALALAQAAGQVGGPQIRQQGTIGGNVVSAQPAADGALTLFAFDAVVEVAGRPARRSLPLAQAYLGPGRSALDPRRELLVRILIEPRRRGQGSDYQRLALRRALQLPILAAAIWLDLQNGLIRSARISLGPVAPTPYRAVKAEEFLAGRPANEESFRQAGRLVSQDVNPRDSRLRGSGAYRREMAAVLVRRGLVRAAARAAADG
ncbi:MAG: FAD binding domain-containing protein [Thermodesulfobacteriota bacterium]